MSYLYDEDQPKGKLLLNHPDKEWVKKEINNFEAKDIRVKMIEDGKLIYTLPTIEQTRNKVQEELKTLWTESLRFENPQTYTVNLSDKLADVKKSLLNKNESFTQ
jgi:nicotinate phosphoribosyltransferase